MNICNLSHFPFCLGGQDFGSGHCLPFKFEKSVKLVLVIEYISKK